MPGDDRIYGFNKADTIELINLIGNADAEFAEGAYSRDIGGGGAKHAARMMANWSSKTVSAQIYTLDGVTATYKETTTLYDPLSVFAALGTNDWLYCTFQGGKYYGADPGSCPGTSPLIASPPATQPS